MCICRVAVAGVVFVSLVYKFVFWVTFVNKEEKSDLRMTVEKGTLRGMFGIVCTLFFGTDPFK